MKLYVNEDDIEKINLNHYDDNNHLKEFNQEKSTKSLSKTKHTKYLTNHQRNANQFPKRGVNSLYTFKYYCSLSITLFYLCII